MAKLQGPLFAQSASGRLGNTLTFSERASGSQVRFQRQQKDVITALRTAHRDKFVASRDSWKLLDFGKQELGFFLLGGNEVDISSMPLEKRAPQFACYVRDFLKYYY